MTSLTDSRPLPPGLQVLERGWLSSNNTLLLGAPDEPALLVDSGHVCHAAQTVRLVETTLAGRPLGRLLNTHLHSDHCGGNAALQAAWPDLRTEIPPGQAEAARQWDEAVLTHGPTGQRCARFRVDGVIEPGTAIEVGAARWQVLAAPGHDPHSLIFFEPEQGVLLSADALWEHGYGVVFPELEGESGFDEVAAVLALIATLPVRWVVPGHGRPFQDVAAALARARERLAAQRAAPQRHARHAAKVLLKYHLMEERAQPLETLLAWCEATPLLARIRVTAGEPRPLRDWGLLLVDELVGQGALRRETLPDGAGVRVVDAG